MNAPVVITPEQATAMQARYTGRKADGPSLMDGDVPVPSDDKALVALIQQSKATIDANGGIARLSTGMKAHVRAVLDALEKYAESNPQSQVAQRLLAAIRSDPALAPYL